MSDSALTAEDFDSPDLLLASRSPRRRELLTQVGISFDLSRVVVAEIAKPDETPHDYVRRVALDKALAGWDLDGRPRELPVLGADTTVVIGDTILGKPRDRAQVLEMMQLLSGKTHQVMSAVAIIKGEQQDVCVVTTDVTFRKISPEEVIHYWNTGEPVDKAGGYAIQGYGAAFVENIRGSYSNVVGLPLFETIAMLKAFDVQVLGQ